jgi:large subunit ribosomal protein L3
MKCIIGKKLGMTTLFDEEKGALNVTLIACEKNTVTANRTLEKDGYIALQVETQKTAKKTVRKEFRIDRAITESDRSVATKELAKELEKFPVASDLSVTQFVVGDKVNVSGVTKSKGFQGVVKRHGFGGQMTSHGRKHDIRKPGSIGATFPEHVVKGRRMAGRMGGENMTALNLSVVYVNEAEGLIGVRGAVPGVNGRVVKVMGVN